MNPFFGLDLARSRQQDLVRDANDHRRGPRKRRGLDLQQSKRRIPMAESQNDERILAERFVTMLNDHDPDAVDAFVSVDYINHNPFVGDGREANRTFWASFFTAFPDVEATMDDLVVVGDRVVGRFTYRGTHAGLFYGLPATGKSIEMRSIDIWRAQNGEFVEHWDELNLLDVFQQLGLIPVFDLVNAESTS
jgi:steroid delta-isomerase-like uncharacterized protein